MRNTRDFFKKTGDIKGNFHARMGMIKDRNSMDLTEAEDIKKWQKYTEGLNKKGLNDPDNHGVVMTHLEQDILECEVKRALGSITMNNASGADGIPAELYKILKDDAVKMLTQHVSKYRKLSRGHRTGKDHFSIQPQRRAMSKIVQATLQLPSSHMPARLCSKSFKLGFSSTRTENF